MLILLELTLPFAAIGKPRMTQRDKWAKRPCVLRYREWADAVRAAAEAECLRCGYDFPEAKNVMHLSWVATFKLKPPAKKKPRLFAKGDLHRDKPDRDNIDKGLLDTLFPKGDSAIAYGSIKKIWGDEDKIELTILFHS